MTFPSPLSPLLIIGSTFLSPDFFTPLSYFIPSSFLVATVDLGSNFIFLGPQFGWEARPLPRMLYPTFSPLAPSFGYICICSHTPSFPGNSQRSSIISDTLPKGHKSLLRSIKRSNAGNLSPCIRLE